MATAMEARQKRSGNNNDERHTGNATATMLMDGATASAMDGATATVMEGATAM